MKNLYKVELTLKSGAKIQFRCKELSWNTSNYSWTHGWRGPYLQKVVIEDVVSIVILKQTWI